MFLAGLMMLAAPCAQAAVTIVSGSSGSNISTNSDVAGNLGDIDIDDLSNSGSSSSVPDVNYIQDEDGFFVDSNDQQLSEEEQADLEKQKKAEEEKNKPVQIYRGEEANRPKLEAARTHLMYEKTRY